MRRLSLKSLSLALAGFALVAPSLAQAGNPQVCSTCAGQQTTPHVHNAKVKAKVKMGHHLCGDCAAKLAMASGQPVEVASSGTCSACSATVAAIPASAAAALAPGYAVIGDPSPAPLMASGDAPGHAMVGDVPTVPSEPVPVGVMQTNFRSPEIAGTVGASASANAARGGASGVAGVPFAKPNEVPPSLYTPQGPRRHKFLSRIIGLPDLGRGRAEAESRRRESHAMTSYGPGSAPSDLPASMVYGGK